MNEMNDYDPFLSAYMSVDIDEENIKGAMIERFSYMEVGESEAINLISKALLDEFENLEYFTVRAFKISSLDSFGLARYAIHRLRNSLELYEAITEELNDKRIEASELICDVEAARTEALAAQRGTDSSSSAFHSASRKPTSGRRDIATVLKDRR